MALLDPIYASPSSQAHALKQFLVAHADPLIGAAALLGGRPAVQRTARLLQEVAVTRTLTQRLRREIVGLHRLLALECVQDAESIEAACFAEIDPASPVVERICELADALRAHLSALTKAEAGQPLWKGFSPAA